jgi:hypothetical protein
MTELTPDEGASGFVTILLLLILILGILVTEDL